MQTKKPEEKFLSQVNTQFCNILFSASETLEYENMTLTYSSTLAVHSSALPHTASVILSVGICRYFCSDTYVFLLIYLQLSRQKYLHTVQIYLPVGIR